MKTVSVIPNEKKDRNLAVTKQLLEALLCHPVTILLEQRFQEVFSRFGAGIEFVSEEALFSRSECIIALGGDGTILSLASHAAKWGKPICGINMGKVGFMAALEQRELDKIHRLFTGEYTLSDRMLLSCFVNGTEVFSALNEIVIAPEKGFHIVELDLFASRRRLCAFRADGVIFNTPTGSTGYSFSAGGAVVEDTFDCIGVKAISSYLLRGAHHMIFSPKTVFTAKNIRTEGKVTVCADGREEITLKPEDVVKICQSRYKVSLVQFSPRSNQEIFFRKF